MNIYFEARGEPVKTQIAVAAVTINRMKSKDYPKTICGVVKARGAFSWTKKKNKIKEKKTFEKCKKIAHLYLLGKLKSPIGKRCFFNGIQEFKTKHKPMRIGKLIFY